MTKLFIEDLNLSQKNVLMRVDFNVPLKDSVIRDDLRIRAALPSIRKILEDGGRAILCSHLGRPEGEKNEKYSLRPVAKHLEELLGQKVAFMEDCVGPEVDEAKAQLPDKAVLLLENLRFHKGETDNDSQFAKELSKNCDLYVNDAFGTAHRAHASTQGVTAFFSQCAAGYLMEKELRYLGESLENPKRPFVTILGGAKVSGKIDVIQNLLGKADTLIIGGGMTYTFLKAQGIEIGDSLVEEDRLAMALEILAKAKESKTQLELAVDVVIADKFAADANVKTVAINEIPVGWQGLDIGEKSIEKFQKILANAKTILWNGPLGVFEIPAFERGTKAIAESLASVTATGATTIIGGGDSASAVKKFGLEDQLSHVSTGGGASLEFLEGKALPGVAALSDK